MHSRSSPGGSRPSIISSKDRNGRVVVSVSILNSQDTATLYVEDWLALITAHGFSAFYRNKAVRHAGHVLFKSKRDRRVYVVARAIMGDRKGSMVEVADGDLSNLRRSNLYYRKGGTGGIRRSDGKARAEPAGADLGAEAASVA